MKKCMPIILITLLALLGACSGGLHRRPVTEGPVYKVAVMHSYDSLQNVYSEYDSCLLAEFEKNGINVEIWNYYLDVPEADMDMDLAAETFRRFKEDKVDLVISEGDMAARAMLEMFSYHQMDVPLICGGVTIPDWNKVSLYPKTYVWYNEPDYAGILLEIHRLTKSNIVMVELDYDYHDSLFRIQSKHIGERIPVVNDMVGATTPQVHENVKDIFCVDSLVVVSVSLAHPERNVLLSQALGIDTLCSADDIFKLALRIPQLTVKKDLYNTIVIDKASKPQFTCLPYNFNLRVPVYLAGYFVPMSTQAHDVVHTATQIIKGDTDHMHKVNAHRARAFMDYRAMAFYDLDIKEMSRHYTIINLPEKKLNRLTLYLLVTLFSVALCIAIGSAMVYYNNRRKNAMERRIRTVDAEQLILASDKCNAFEYIEGGNVKIYSVATDYNIATSEYTLDKFTELIPDSEFAKVLYLRNAFKTEGQYDGEIPLTTNKGVNVHWWRLRFYVERGKEDGPIRVNGVMIMADDERKRKAEQEEAQNEALLMQEKERFLNNINHEIRSPLNVILGYCQALTSGDCVMTQEESDTFGQAMKQASEKLQNLVQDILTYSRMNSGRMTFELVQTSVDEIMDSLANIYKSKLARTPLFDENDVEKTGKLNLVYARGTSGLNVKVDISCLRLAFGHLMSNAIKYTDKGDIRIGWILHMKEREVEIFVEDSGPGIDKQKLKILFRPFAKMKESGIGKGLGLTLVQSIAQGMNGRVSVQSIVGIGSRFSITLPIC